MKLTFGLFIIIALASFSGAVVTGIVGMDWCIDVTGDDNANWSRTGPSLCVLIPFVPIFGVTLFLSYLLIMVKENQ